MAVRPWIGIIGVGAFASAVTWFGILHRDPAMPAGQIASAAQPSAPSPVAAAAPVTATAPGAAATSGTPSVAVPDPAPQPAGPSPEPRQQASVTPGQTPAAAAVPTPPASQAKPAAAVPVPTFDIVRVEPSGDTVVAGQGMPGATVELLRNGQTYARTVADVGGQWAIVPPPLPKGPAELMLRVTTPDGRTATSDQVVTVRVPEMPGEQVVVVLNAPDAPSKVLAGIAAPAAAPGAATVAEAPAVVAKPAQQMAATDPGAGAAPPAAGRTNARIEAVEADEAGRFFVTGVAEPGATIRIYLNDTPVANVQAAKDGAFGMRVEKGVTPGRYRVRIDDIDTGTGHVLTRAEVPFTMDPKVAQTAPAAVIIADAKAPSAASETTVADAGTSAAAPASGSPGTDTSAGSVGELSSSAKAGTLAAAAPAPTPSVAVVPEIRTVAVVRGDNLWRISRKTYGEGIRYTVIYDANAQQIRNPNLIYPGQIFVMPEAKGG